MRLAIVMPPMASMPLVNGGGVERLVGLFLRENEKSQSPISITVISRYDEDSEKLADSYPHAKFLYVRIPRSEPPSNEFLTKFTGVSMRRDYLLNSIGESQIFLTCCDKELFSGLEDGKVFIMEKGKITVSL